MPSIPSMKAAADCSPRSTSFKPDSHRAVRLADFTVSGRTAIRSVPFFVGSNCLPLRSKNPPRTSFSSTPARVAGVPRPVRSTSPIWANSWALACSMAERSRSSVKCRGGLMAPSFADAFTFSKVCPWERGGRAFGSSFESLSGFFFRVERNACSTSVNPGETITRPFAVNRPPPQVISASVSS